MKATADFVYPRGGWTRAFHYVKHRLRRMPGTPDMIARGIWAGVFTTFTPFYGLHFLVAAFIARIINGKVLAALLATFFGNPLTYFPIGVISLQTGHFILGTEFKGGTESSLSRKFADAAKDLWTNFQTIFNDQQPDWSGLKVFYDEVFFPYMIGGIIPGIVAATICYYLSVPVIHAYQKRRAARMKKRLEATLRKARDKRAKQGTGPSA